MFLSKRVVPQTPPSLVKLRSSTVRVTNGCCVSAPSSDQVPELKKAQSPPLAGTAATADPVSCEAGATTDIAPTPQSSATL